MKGYDYLTQEDLNLPVREWRERMRPILGAGGFRRVESGETFIHEKNALIRYEIYGNVQPEKSRAAS